VTERAGPTRICLGVVATAHGIRGEVKIKCFASDPNALTAYGPLTDEQGNVTYRVLRYRANKDGVIAALAGVADRNAAEALRGARLFVERSRLPAPKAEEFYQADLLGLPVRHRDGRTVGTVAGVHNYGAGDIIEIKRTDGGSALVPFARDFVPAVDVASGLVIDTEDEWLFVDRPAKGAS
jgi:16S rRNA processing protein RimM